MIISGSSSRRDAGLTVVELLVAGVIVVTVLGLASLFFAQQTRLQQRVQARNEVQDRVRVAMQLVMQDLALAGNSVYLAASGAKDDAASWPYCFDGGKQCLTMSSDGPDSTTITVRYLSTQFPVASACRDVSYRLLAGTLERSDVPCEQDPIYSPLADLVTEFKAEVICSDGNAFKEFPTVGCGNGVSYGRSAEVSISAVSRPVRGISAADDCAADRVCFSMTQEALIPNLKDG